MLFMSCICHAFTSAHCSLVVICWERADLLALVCDVLLGFCHFPIGILIQVWCLIVSIPDLATFLTSNNQENAILRKNDYISTFTEKGRYTRVHVVINSSMGYPIRINNLCFAILCEVISHCSS